MQVLKHAAAQNFNIFWKYFMNILKTLYMCKSAKKIYKENK